MNATIIEWIHSAYSEYGGGVLGEYMLGSVDDWNVVIVERVESVIDIAGYT